MPNKSGKPNRPPGRPPGRKATTVLYARIEPALGDAIDRYLESLRPKPTASELFRVAMEEYLAKVGFWPPGEGE